VNSNQKSEDRIQESEGRRQEAERRGQEYRNTGMLEYWNDGRMGIMGSGLQYCNLRGWMIKGGSRRSASLSEP